VTRPIAPAATHAVLPPSTSACRFCASELRHIFCDLGVSPLSNSYVTEDRYGAPEPFYPLRALVCEQCLLVQLEEFASAESIFSDYAYFSSYSSSWLEHARRYVEATSERFGLGVDSQVIELASNDGYLLRYFRDRGIPVLGVEPAANVAEVARREHDIPTLVEFFGREVASRLATGRRADLLLGNNVLAHVPDLNDFVAGMKILLAEDGVLTMEFPHLLRLMAENQFDTIYHEHFSYFSFNTVRRVFGAHGLRLWDVEELTTHGGSLRIYGCHAEADRADTESVGELLGRERASGLEDLDTYLAYDERARASKRDILTFFIDLKRDGRRIAGYGAPAKGNTLLNYCGIGRDLVDFTVDRNPVKQGTFLPGSRIPVLAPEALDEARPDIVLILPWNLRDEIIHQLAHVRDWGGRFAARVPELTLLS